MEISLNLEENGKFQRLVVSHHAINEKEFCVEQDLIRNLDKHSEDFKGFEGTVTFNQKDDKSFLLSFSEDIPEQLQHKIHQVLTESQAGMGCP